MTVPKYLEAITASTSESEDALHVKIGIDNTDRFELYYAGELEEKDGVVYIVGNDDEESSVLILKIKDVTGEMHVVYDGRIHGYDNMFCNEHAEKEFQVKKLEYEGESLFSLDVTLGYGIDYDDEKGDYEIGTNDMLKVLNRKDKISWEQVKEEGFDWITIQLKSENGKSIFIDEELA